MLHDGNGRLTVCLEILVVRSAAEVMLVRQFVIVVTDADRRRGRIDRNAFRGI